MKYILPGIIFLAVGYIAGYWFTATDDHARKARPTVEARVEKRVEPEAAPDDSSEPFTLNAIEQQPTIFDKLYLAHKIAASVSPQELESLLLETIRHEDPLFNFNIASIFIEKWTTYDPEGALEFITAHPQMNQQSFPAHVLTSWARHDPEAALAYFRQMDDRQLKFFVGTRLLEDPTMAWLSTEIQNELGPYAEGLARNIRLNQMPPREAFDAALSMTGRERGQMLINVAARWAQIDPESAMAHIANMGNHPERRALMQTVLVLQARVDADNALTLLALYAPDDHRLEQQVLQSFAHNNPVEALPYVERYTDRMDQIIVLAGLLTTWVQQDPSAALDYARMLSPRRQHDVYRAMAFGYARSHPEDALRWALNLGPEFKDAKSTVLGSISQNHTGLAEQNMDLVQDPELRELMIQRIALAKSQQDLTGAMDWITSNTRPQTESRHRAIASVARQVSRREPERAMELIDRLPRGAIRENASRSLAFLWARREPARTEEIISKLGLSQADAQRLRQQSANPPSLNLHATP